MALAPRFAGQRFTAASSGHALHTLELYLDYVCPFSKKLFDTVYTSVIPSVKSKYADKVQIIFRQQIQPWHPSSTLVHEAGVAVLKLSPGTFWEFSKKLFEDQESYFDGSVVNETRNETYKRLAKLGASVGVDEEKLFDLLKIGSGRNSEGALNFGNGVTDDLKVLVKVNRLTGVHVTPTVLFNGVVENSISSGWSGQQWEEWLEKNIS